MSGGGPGVRHVIYLGGNPEPDDAAAAAVLTALRSGLDRLEDGGGEQPEIWIERGQASADAVLTPDSYIRVLKGGTRSVEVLRPTDAIAIRQALDANHRRDVRVTIRWVGTAVPGPEQTDLGRALACADCWVLPSQAIAAAVEARDAAPAQAGSGKRILIHPLPEQPAADPVALARAYRASVAAILATSAPRAAPPL